LSEFFNNKNETKNTETQRYSDFGIPRLWFPLQKCDGKAVLKINGKKTGGGNFGSV